ncbi:MAG TPA: nuclear transport factor 2 family protein [Acidimicrobiales bacterium]|nr:nuclear transport factor 2 family protein [Acidimicrobiales bacterium]
MTDLADRAGEGSLGRLEIGKDRMESWIAIHDLVHTYPHALDRHDAETFASLWHPDGVWDFGADYGTYRGVDAMVAFVSRSWGIQDGHHLVTNAVIRFRDDGTAYGCSSAYAQVSQHDGPTLFPMVVSYDDEYCVHDGRWVFRERRVATDHRGLSADELDRHRRHRSEAGPR